MSCAWCLFSLIIYKKYFLHKKKKILTLFGFTILEKDYNRIYYRIFTDCLLLPWGSTAFLVSTQRRFYFPQKINALPAPQTDSECLRRRRCYM
jgi:hypothetical protein